MVYQPKPPTPKPVNFYKIVRVLIGIILLFGTAIGGYKLANNRSDDTTKPSISPTSEQTPVTVTPTQEPAPAPTEEPAPESQPTIAPTPEHEQPAPQQDNIYFTHEELNYLESVYTDSDGSVLDFTETDIVYFGWAACDYYLNAYSEQMVTEIFYSNIAYITEYESWNLAASARVFLCPGYYVD